jgi:ferredoxin-NADP reductase
VAGDFVLPKDSSKSIVFVAGGIGVTPFVSMLQSMLESKQKYNATLYYFASDKSEIVHKELLRKAGTSLGIRVIPKVGSGSRLSEADIKDNKDSTFYLSGPPGLVNTYKSQLKTLGVKNINVDYFNGY